MEIDPKSILLLVVILHKMRYNEKRTLAVSDERQERLAHSDHAEQVDLGHALVHGHRDELHVPQHVDARVVHNSPQP